jgi:predicted ATPase
MSTPCACRRTHEPRRIVLTGGPGAGKTAVLHMLRLSLCPHVLLLPESAGIIFGGGFPRGNTPELQQAAQRAIFFVQRELEATAVATNAALVLCDRGMIDGIAYWPGPGDFWASVGVPREAVLQRYDAVLHLRTPDAAHGYGHQNPLRLESSAEAAAIDARIFQAWDGHPRRFIVDATSDFLMKAERVLEIVRGEVPGCCRDHGATETSSGGSSAAAAGQPG